MNSLFQKDFIVYILSDKRKFTKAGITVNGPEFLTDMKTKFNTLVYFDRFNDRKKALRKKRSILNMENKERILFVKKNNPEWLNLIFTLTENNL